MLRAGEIYDGLAIAPHSSDTEAFLTALAAVFDRSPDCCQNRTADCGSCESTCAPDRQLSAGENGSSTDPVHSLICQLRGPYAFVFWHKKSQQLICGRDPLGRRSLLMSSSKTSPTVLTSVQPAPASCQHQSTCQPPAGSSEQSTDSGAPVSQSASGPTQVRSINSIEASTDGVCHRHSSSKTPGQLSAACDEFIEVPPGVYRCIRLRPGEISHAGSAGIETQRLPHADQVAPTAPCTETQAESGKPPPGPRDSSQEPRRDTSGATSTSSSRADPVSKHPSPQQTSTQASTTVSQPVQALDCASTAAPQPPVDQTPTLPAWAPLTSLTNTPAFTAWQRQLHQHRPAQLTQPPEALPAPLWPDAIHPTSLAPAALASEGAYGHSPHNACPSTQPPQAAGPQIQASEGARGAAHANGLQAKPSEAARRCSSVPRPSEPPSETGASATSIPPEPAGSRCEGTPSRTAVSAVPRSANEARPAAVATRGGGGGAAAAGANPQPPVRHLPDAFERGTQSAVEATLAALVTSMRRRCLSIDPSPSVGAAWCGP